MPRKTKKKRRLVKGKDWHCWMLVLDGKPCWWMASKYKPKKAGPGIEYVKVKLVKVK